MYSNVLVHAEGLQNTGNFKVTILYKYDTLLWRSVITQNFSNFILNETTDLVPHERISAAEAYEQYQQLFDDVSEQRGLVSDDYHEGEIRAYVKSKNVRVAKLQKKSQHETLSEEEQQEAHRKYIFVEDEYENRDPAVDFNPYLTLYKKNYKELYEKKEPFFFEFFALHEQLQEIGDVAKYKDFTQVEKIKKEMLQNLLGDDLKNKEKPLARPSYEQFKSQLIMSPLLQGLKAKLQELQVSLSSLKEKLTRLLRKITQSEEERFVDECSDNNGVKLDAVARALDEKKDLTVTFFQKIIELLKEYLKKTSNTEQQYATLLSAALKNKNTALSDYEKFIKIIESSLEKKLTSKGVTYTFIFLVQAFLEKLSNKEDNSEINRMLTIINEIGKKITEATHIKLAKSRAQITLKVYYKENLQDKDFREKIGEINLLGTNFLDSVQL